MPWCEDPDNKGGREITQCTDFDTFCIVSENPDLCHRAADGRIFYVVSVFYAV